MLAAQRRTRIIISTITDLGGADILVTDARTREQALATLKGHVGEVRVAPIAAAAPDRQPKERP